MVFALGTTPAGGATVDRVVASLGRTAITASDVEREYRLELLLEGKASTTEPAGEVLDQVRNKIIDRVLLEEEVRSSGIQVNPNDPSVTERAQDAHNKFATKQAFEDALSGVGMSEGELQQYFANQAAVLLLIDRRLRPEVSVEPAEIEAYYQGTLIPELQRQKQDQALALSDVEDRIREILVQKKINVLLEAWLEHLRNERDVKLYGGAAAEDKS